MPRALPRYDVVLDKEIQFSLSYASNIEQARTFIYAKGKKQISMSDLEFSYELAFLRIFLAWEILLEQSFLRLICGYQHSGGQEPLVVGKTYFWKVTQAEAAVLGGKDYKLWHNPKHVITRAQQFLSGSRYELTIASTQSRLELI